MSDNEWVRPGQIDMSREGKTYELSGTGESQMVREVTEEPRESGAPDFDLLDAPVAVEENAAYEVPDLKKVARLEEETREAMTTVRDQASLNIANLATDGLHHFLVNINGAELCGGCGDPFPCSTWTDDIEPRNQAWSSGGPVPGEDKARAVAELLGVDIEKARQIVLTSTPLDRL